MTDRVDMVYKDLPRLASKINVYGREGPVVVMGRCVSEHEQEQEDVKDVEQQPVMSPEDTDSVIERKQIRNWESLCNVLDAVSAELETQELHDALCETLETSKGEIIDFPSQDKARLLQSIFEKHLLVSILAECIVNS